MKQTITLFFIALSLGVSLNAQIATTVAGNGIAAFSGDGGPATAAQLYYPQDVKADAAGNIYISESGNSRIRKINALGVISTIAGNGSFAYGGDGGPATAAALNQPDGIALDGTGNIYIADYDNNRIRKVTTGGTITTVAGNGTAGYSGDGGPATGAELNNPAGVAVDGSGNLYIADQANNCVRKVRTSGVITTFAGTDTSGFRGDGGPASAARFYRPSALAIDRAGNIFIADAANQRMRKVNLGDTISTVVGFGHAGYYGDGGPAVDAEVEFISGIIFDSTGNMFFADYGNACLRKVDASGIITRFAGNATAPGYSGDGGPATAAGMDASGVAYANGNLYIADNSNHRVRKICSLPVPGSITGAASVCAGATMLLSDSSATGMWTSRNTSIATVDNTGSVSGIAAGLDSIVLTVTNSCGAVFIADTVRVNPLPDAGVISGRHILFCPHIGSTDVLTDSVSGGIWHLSDTSLATISNTGVVTAAQSWWGAPESAFYIVANSCGSDTAIFSLSTYCEGSVDILNASPIKVSIFPNPFSDRFSFILKCPFAEPAEATITNLTGLKVKEFSITTNEEQEVQLNEPPGIYFISVVTAYGTYAGKVVLEGR